MVQDICDKEIYPARFVALNTQTGEKVREDIYMGHTRLSQPCLAQQTLSPFVLTTVDLVFSGGDALPIQRPNHATGMHAK